MRGNTLSHISARLVICTAAVAVVATPARVLVAILYGGVLSCRHLEPLATARERPLKLNVWGIGGDPAEYRHGLL